ncbi:MAG: hypothetical protein IPJ13_25970 [Saprospiraceae bacterium]|nr:hypothetical protein [Saprospiraceae bacterium]
MFYDLNAYNNISTSIGFPGFGRRGDNVTNATFMDPSIGLDQIYTRNSFSLKA